MPLTDFQLRVVEEKTALDAKLSKLRPFLATELFRSLPEAEQDRMHQQHCFMRAYSNVLGERIAAFASSEQPPCDNAHVAEGYEKFTP